jgi:hypothetical protein
LFWGGVTVYKLLNNSGFDGTEEVWTTRVESRLVIPYQ